MAKKILVADDEKSIRDTMKIVFSEEGYECDTAEDGEETLKLISDNNYDLLICDIRMPKVDGLEVLKKSVEICPETSVIMMTAYASIDTAVESLRMGAFDYLIKPLEFDQILLRIKRLFEYKDIALENQHLRKELQGIYNFQNIIGKSKPMQEVFKLIKKVINTKNNVLITGASGTGKELVARAIHFSKPDMRGKFIAINCGAISETLMESELFGHKRGAFTGAVKDKEGFFKTASGGTLFLDEIGEMPLHLQVKLLRAIEEKEIIPVGSSIPEKVDTRIIAASNKDLYELVKAKKFREDLYYRLNVVEIKLPTLQERREDIPLLINHFIQKYNKELKRFVKGVTNETMKIFLNYNWKGGIRELENVIERAIILTEEDYITPDLLPPDLSGFTPPLEISDNFKLAMKVYEKEHIIKILEKFNYDKLKASKALGMSLSSLYRKMDELEIPLKQDKKDKK
ncbi:sigma-54-dependent Fis family transcriptional regulator [candidate division KSB1 bacterium]|nr:MAG: sigma-54-dependent Fis family transcriptional regulator [candidate division KSB1 bacterium]